jgi:hypothetical protein
MGHFLWLSDLHVDPLYGTEFAVTHHNSMSDDIGNCTQNETLLQYPYGRTGCDSPISLLDSSLQSFLVKNDNNNTSTATSTKIDFILITGDLVRHGTDRLFSSSSKSLTLGDKNISDDIIIDDGPISFTKSILSTTIRSIKKSFPNVPIIPVLGNNDVTPDYYLDVNNNNNNNGTSTNTILDMARDGLSECFLSEEESQTFAYGGYYSRIIQTTSSSSILIINRRILFEMMMMMMIHWVNLVGSNHSYRRQLLVRMVMIIIIIIQVVLIMMMMILKLKLMLSGLWVIYHLPSVAIGILNNGLTDTLIDI